VKKSRSDIRIIQSGVSVKSWRERLPSVGQVRPGQCPRCASPGDPLDGPKCIHGHGLRERQALGPREPCGPPVEDSVLARRFRCVVCRAILVVVPCGLLRYRRYTAMAIGYAVALFGLLKLPATEVRERTCAWSVVGDAAVGRWETLRRWLRAIRSGDLFPDVRRCPAEWTLRQVAERAAATLVAQSIPSCPPPSVEAQAFEGAMRMA
jgi:hypothetical protein